MSGSFLQGAVLIISCDFTEPEGGDRKGSLLKFLFLWTVIGLPRSQKAILLVLGNLWLS